MKMIMMSNSTDTFLQFLFLFFLALTTTISWSLASYLRKSQQCRRVNRVFSCPSSPSLSCCQLSEINTSLSYLHSHQSSHAHILHLLLSLFSWGSTMHREPFNNSEACLSVVLLLFCRWHIIVWLLPTCKHWTNNSWRNTEVRIT